MGDPPVRKVQYRRAEVASRRVEAVCRRVKAACRRVQAACRRQPLLESLGLRLRNNRISARILDSNGLVEQYLIRIFAQKLVGDDAAMFLS